MLNIYFLDCRIIIILHYDIESKDESLMNILGKPWVLLCDRWDRHYLCECNKSKQISFTTLLHLKHLTLTVPVDKLSPLFLSQKNENVNS